MGNVEEMHRFAIQAGSDFDLRNTKPGLSQSTIYLFELCSGRYPTIWPKWSACQVVD